MSFSTRFMGGGRFSRNKSGRSRRLSLVAAVIMVGVLIFAPVTYAADPKITCSPEEIRATERWWFMLKSGLDFGISGNGDPIAINNTANIDAATTNIGYEGTTVVSDVKGNLLFWSDGLNIYNAEQKIMPNGSGIMGNISSDQTVVSFPSIKNPNRLFVVTTSGDGSAGIGHLYYSIIDMSLDDGRGDVLANAKDIMLGPDTYNSGELLTAVPNATGDGFWVIALQPDSDQLLAYEFDSDGPKNSGNPVATTLSEKVNDNGYGNLTFNAQMTQLALVAANKLGQSTTVDGGLAFLLKFDAATGRMTETAKWQLFPNKRGAAYSADFSPSGRYLYVTNIYGWREDEKGIYRFDVSSGNSTTIAASEMALGEITTMASAIRRGPNGKMYISHGRSDDNGNGAQGSLHVINDPDNATNPDFVSDGLWLNGGLVSHGLPQMVTGCPSPDPNVEQPPVIPNDPPKPPNSGVTIANVSTAVGAIGSIMIGLLIVATILARKRVR